jgi:pimeloyl-ACP methyl ester carboxylesterase
MGGWIGYGIALHARHRFRSLILGGAHPFSENMQGFRNMIPVDPDDFPTLLEPAYGLHLSPGMRKRVVMNDPAAILALMSDRDDISTVLPRMTMPCLLFAGSADPRLAKIASAARLMPDANFFVSPDCTHVAAWARSELVLPHVHGFLDERSVRG